MGTTKAPALPRQPGVYRDEPDRDDAASMSSAVLLDEIDDFPDEDLPAYSDGQSYTDGTPTTSTPAPSTTGAGYVRSRPGEETYNPYVLHFFQQLWLTNSSQSPPRAFFLEPQCRFFGNPHPVSKLQRRGHNSIQHAPTAGLVPALLLRPIGWNTHRDCTTK